MNQPLPNKISSKRQASLVQTIVRANNLLESLSKAPKGLSLGELAEKVDLPKGTTHRLVSSLTYFNYVKQNPSSRRYSLGFKLVSLRNKVLDQFDLRNESRPFLFELAQKAQETTHLAVLDNDKALYIDKIQFSSDGLHMASRIGLRAPLHCTAVGEILLAHMPQTLIERIIEQKDLPRRTIRTLTNAEQLKSHLQRIKRQGYAIDNEEDCEGVRCVAAPVHNMKGKVVAAISISAPAVRLTMAIARKSMKPLAMETAKKISNQFGYPEIIDLTDV